MTAEERLETAVQALKRIAEGDSGPAYYIAKAALEEIEDATGSEATDDDPRQRAGHDNPSG